MFVLATVLAVLMAGFDVAPVSAGATRFVVTERFAFKLVNCLRTGGKITKAGKCRGYGSGKYARYRAPLKYSRKISDKVAWPWARKSAIANVCGHSLAGSTIDKRFRAAGLKAANAENVGCGTSWKPRQMVITVLRWWQAEKAYRGWHWRQLRDKDFKSMGVGVAKLGNGRTRLVVNFYAKTPA
ncbi:MAG: CAP domain-containing protein [Chloroflexota bacterium]